MEREVTTVGVIVAAGEMYPPGPVVPVTLSCSIVVFPGGVRLKLNVSGLPGLMPPICWPMAIAVSPPLLTPSDAFRVTLPLKESFAFTVTVKLPCVPGTNVLGAERLTEKGSTNV